MKIYTLTSSLLSISSYLSFFLTYWEHGCELQVELTGVDGPDHSRGPGRDDAPCGETFEVHVAERDEEEDKEGGD